MACMRVCGVHGQMHVRSVRCTWSCEEPCVHVLAWITNLCVSLHVYTIACIHTFFCENISTAETAYVSTCTHVTWLLLSDVCTLYMKNRMHEWSITIRTYFTRIPHACIVRQSCHVSTTRHPCFPCSAASKFTFISDQDSHACIHTRNQTDSTSSIQINTTAVSFSLSLSLSLAHVHTLISTSLRSPLC
jgi:hypothetical protein